jgi:hypothetical protein
VVVDVFHEIEVAIERLFDFFLFLWRLIREEIVNCNASLVHPEEATLPPGVL